jgi:hypothetical protein
VLPKPQMQNIEYEEEIEDLAINTILIFNLQMTNRFVVIIVKMRDVGCKDLKIIC